MKSTIQIYTDGSCHTQQLIGAWGAIILINDKKVVLSNIETDTTHNRMELLGVIKAVEYLEDKNLTRNSIEVYSDSQYVVNLLTRKTRLKQKNFITKKGTPIQNSDLVQRLIQQIETHDINFTKVKAHQKDGDAMNREVDILVRNLVRTKVSEHGK
ncbi:MAG: ribonuclease HI [Sphingobacteriaceae bacterium]|nr:ribonuclease HI [Sphingobacteriaceae bacterium]